MHNKSIILAASLFIVLVAGMFIYTYLKQVELNSEPLVVTEPEVIQEDPYADIMRVDAKHFYINGEHIVVGELTMPTLCDLLESEATVLEDTNTAMLSFTVINTTPDCERTPTQARFRAAVAGPEDLVWQANIEGRDVMINLIESAAGESPDDYEIYFKG